MKPLLLGIILHLTLAVYAQQSDAKAFFETFVKVQNDHNLNAVSNLFVNSPQFLWITKGTAIWGKENALERFGNLYKGTWHLEPEMQDFTVWTLDRNTQQIFVPIVVTIGDQGKEEKKKRRQGS